MCQQPQQRPPQLLQQWLVCRLATTTNLADVIRVIQSKPSMIQLPIAATECFEDYWGLYTKTCTNDVCYRYVSDCCKLFVLLLQFIVSAQNADATHDFNKTQKVTHEIGCAKQTVVRRSRRVLYACGFYFTRSHLIRAVILLCHYCFRFCSRLWWTAK